MKTIDWTKPVETCEGCDVRIYAKDGAPGASIHGAYKTDRGWINTTWWPDGGYVSGGNRGGDMDLRNKSLTIYVSVYQHDNGRVEAKAHVSKSEAEYNVSPHLGIRRALMVPVNLT